MKYFQHLDQNFLALSLAFLSLFLMAEEAPNPEQAPPKEEQSKVLEPGFIPKTEQAKEWLDLSSKLQKNENELKSMKEFSDKSRTNILQRYRKELESYTESRIPKTEDNYHENLLQAISAYEEVRKNSLNDSKLLMEALYNLGWLYFEVDERDYFTKLAEYNQAQERGLGVPYPEENFNRTIEAYETLMEEFPEFYLMDNVYYLYGLAMWYEGAFQLAVKTFKKLIEKHPTSRFVEEVQFRLGEFYYDMDEYDEAIAAYEILARNPESTFHDKALYKIAWAHFQKDRYELAIENFLKTLAAIEKEETSDMHAEVVRYIVKSFSERLLLAEFRKTKLSKKEEAEYNEKLGFKVASKIIAYFTELKNPTYTREIYIETASQLIEDGKVDGAVVALQAVIDLDPNHFDNPRLSAQIVDTYVEAGRTKEARAESQKLIASYGNGSAWYENFKNDKKSLAQAQEAVRDSMLLLAVFYHQSAKEASDAGDIEKANTNFLEASLLYSRYINEYPEREDITKAVFYFAESSYELKRYNVALEAYQLLKDFPLPVPDPFRRDATYNIVFTFRHVLKDEILAKRFKEVDFDALTSKQKGEAEEEIPNIGLRYIAAIDEFIKLAPDDEQVPVLKFHSAAIYYVYGHHIKALAAFLHIIDTYPKTKAASVAGRLMIDDAVSAEEWAKVVELSERFRLADLGGESADFKKIGDFGRFKVARGVFEEANALQKNNQVSQAKAKYKEAAEKFAILLQEDPKSPYVDVMLFNAAMSIAHSGTMTKALPLYRELYTKYPKSEFAKPARFQEAMALEKMLKFTESAKAYDGIIKEDPSSETAKDAMLNKALLYEAAGDNANAAKSFSEFANRYPERSEAPDALLTAAGIYKKTGQVNQQIAILERFIKQYSKDESKRAAIIEARVSLGDTYAELLAKAKSPSLIKQYEKARLNNYSLAVKLFSANLPPIAAFYSAKAQSILNKPEQDAFRRMHINASSGKGQAEQLTAMTSKLTKLAADNEAIIKNYAQPVWNAESLRRIGALYEHLASSILKAPCPKDVKAIDEFACDEYTVLLEDKAAVLEEKALSAYKQAYEIAMSSYDAPADLLENIQKGLNRLKPGEYQKVGEVIEQPKKGDFYGMGRKLSTGQMASSLHPEEQDPDTGVKKVPEKVPEKVPVDEPLKEEEPDTTKSESTPEATPQTEEVPAEEEVEDTKTP